MDYISNSTQETENLAEKFLNSFPETNLIGLSGDLGSGKTAFVKGVAKNIGIKKNITSPTFVIEKKYHANNRNLVHIDAYRLLSVFDLEAIGFRESVEDKNNLVVVEWPEKVFSEFPEKMKIINFSYIDENTRKITF